jgi:hypothetical protein
MSSLQNLRRVTGKEMKREYYNHALSRGVDKGKVYRNKFSLPLKSFSLFFSFPIILTFIMFVSGVSGQECRDNWYVPIFLASACFLLHFSFLFSIKRTFSQMGWLK